MKPCITCLFTALCSLVSVAQLHAQDAVFTSRNGGNIAYCGLLFDGPVIHHIFSTPDPTHDIASVTDPGGTNWSPSSAVSQLDVTPSSSGITIVTSGSAMRGPLLGRGVSATADARDDWRFTLTAPARFTWNVSVHGSSSSEVSVPTQGYTFGVFGAGRIFPDPGTSPEAFGGGLSGSGTIIRRASGRIMPGQYEISLNCRVEGNNTHPYDGSFNTTLALELGPDVPVIIRIQILPNGLNLEWTDIAPKQFTVETTGSLSDGVWTPVSGMAWPISAHTVSLPPPSTFPAFYRVKAQ